MRQARLIASIVSEQQLSLGSAPSGGLFVSGAAMPLEGPS